MNPLSSLKVGARLGFGFGTLLLLMTILTGIGLSHLVLLHSHLDRIINQDFARIALVNDMRDAARFQSLALRDVVLQEDLSFAKKELKFMMQARQKYQATAAKLEGMITDPQTRARLAKIKQAEQQIQASVNEALNDSLADDHVTAGEVIRDKVRPRQMQLITQLDQLLAHFEKISRASADQANQAYGSALMFMALIWGAATLLGVIIAFFTTRSITHPLRRAVGLAGRIAQGDLSGRIEVHGSDELATLLLALKDMNQHLLQIIGGVSRAANDVAASSARLSAEAGQVSTRAEAQTERIMQISAAIEEVTVSIAEVAAGATRVAEASVKTETIAASGNDNMTREVDSSRHIVSSVESSGATIEELSGAIQRIGEVTRVIKEIADQTNLLALNAAIEAARAGEQGRGFAVVADEVRKLAERTGSSTADITQVVDVIHHKTEEAVEAMRRARQEVQEESQLTLQTRDILQEIVTAAAEVNKLAQDIANATGEQKAASTETAVGMERISALTEENAASIRQVGSAAEGLAATSAELQGLVGQFKLAD